MQPRSEHLQSKSRYSDIDSRTRIRIKFLSKNVFDAKICCFSLLLVLFCFPPTAYFLIFFCENIKLERLRAKRNALTFIFILSMTAQNSDTNFVHAIFPYEVTHS